MNHETSMSFGHFRVPLQQLTLEKWEKRKKYTTFVLSIGEKTDWQEQELQEVRILKSPKNQLWGQDVTKALTCMYVS